MNRAAVMSPKTGAYDVDLEAVGNSMASFSLGESALQPPSVNVGIRHGFGDIHPLTVVLPHSASDLTAAPTALDVGVAHEQFRRTVESMFGLFGQAFHVLIRVSEHVHPEVMVDLRQLAEGVLLEVRRGASP